MTRIFLDGSILGVLSIENEQIYVVINADSDENPRENLIT